MREDMQFSRILKLTGVLGRDKCGRRTRMREMCLL